MLPKLLPISSPHRGPIQSPRNKLMSLPPVVPSFDTFGDPISVTYYVPSVNPSRNIIEQQVEDLKEEILTTLEQIKALENIITSGEIKLDEAAQLRELYIIKFKRDIYMLETNLNNFPEGNKSHIDLNTETKGDDTKEEVKDNTIRIISVQSKD